ncbi:MAG: hypothetical protein KA368_05020 [Acidobacteria bacterium]|nr:hypothetical protein [Acidobacteriota bacterium]
MSLPDAVKQRSGCHGDLSLYRTGINYQGGRMAFHNGFFAFCQCAVENQPKISLTKFLAEKMQGIFNKIAIFGGCNYAYRAVSKRLDAHPAPFSSSNNSHAICQESHER